jgi:hypothetical protein
MARHLKVDPVEFAEIVSFLGRGNIDPVELFTIDDLANLKSIIKFIKATTVLSQVVTLERFFREDNFATSSLLTEALLLLSLPSKGGAAALIRAVLDRCFLWISSTENDPWALNEKSRIIDRFDAIRLKLPKRTQIIASTAKSSYRELSIAIHDVETGRLPSGLNVELRDKSFALSWGCDQIGKVAKYSITLALCFKPEAIGDLDFENRERLFSILNRSDRQEFWATFS